MPAACCDDTAVKHGSAPKWQRVMFPVQHFQESSGTPEGAKGASEKMQRK